MSSPSNPKEKLVTYDDGEKKRFDPNDFRVVPKFKGGAPTKYNKNMPKKVFDVLKDGGTMTQATSAIGVVKSTLLEWAKTNKELSNAIRSGKEAGEAWWAALAKESCFAGSGINLSVGYVMTMRNMYGMLTKDADTSKEEALTFMENLAAIRSGGKVKDAEWKKQFAKKSGE